MNLKSTLAPTILDIENSNIDYKIKFTEISEDEKTAEV